MLHRCYNPKREKYARYGARGIKVCRAWHTFENFYNDMGASYKDGLTLDRIDNNGDYCPENCKWIETRFQSRNRRNCIHLLVDGKQMLLGDFFKLVEKKSKCKRTVRKMIDAGIRSSVILGFKVELISSNKTMVTSLQNCAELPVEGGS